MINVRELRVGNIILDKDYQLFRIDNEAELAAVKDIPEDLSGLAIKEYWPKEMGFVPLIRPDKFDMCIMGLLTTDLEVTVNRIWRKERFEVSPREPATENIQFVHQVQNWVYDKLGREVTVTMQKMP